MFRISYSDTLLNSCSNIANDTLVAGVKNIISYGELIITKLDKNAGIISGTFNATLYKPGCDTLKITDGRFDMKF